MKTFKLEKSIEVPVSKEKAWDFFSNPNNLLKIMPKSMNFKILYGAELPLHEGQIITYEVTPFKGYKSKWISEISHIRKSDYFVDIQIGGPYKLWHHKHHFKAISENKTLVTDCVHYQLPFGIFSPLMNQLLIAPKLDAIFKYREKHIYELLKAYAN